jgi:hypothetical protein
MPDSAERVFVVEDATNRSSSLYTLTVKTVSGTGVTLPIASTNLVYSDGTNINIDSGNNLASNNLTIGRNSSNILGSASDLVVSTNTAAFTLVYVNATRGWAYKDNI